MKFRLILLIISLFALKSSLIAQEKEKPDNNVFLVPHCIYEGDTIPCVQIRDIYIFKPMVFKNEKQRKEYDKLVRNVKKTLPISKEIYQAVIETYEFLQTLPDKKSKDRHIKNVEKSLKEQYTPRMKKLTFSQGKLLIKLVDRQCNQSSYQLVKAFIGPFRAGIYQTFAGLFGASLKKEYDPLGEDKAIERIVLLVESGQL